MIEELKEREEKLSFEGGIQQALFNKEHQSNDELQGSLKYLLEQRLSMPLQHRWLAKLLGYDYEIVFKNGNENGVADALSRV